MPVGSGPGEREDDVLAEETSGADEHENPGARGSLKPNFDCSGGRTCRVRLNYAFKIPHSSLRGGVGLTGSNLVGQGVRRAREPGRWFLPGGDVEHGEHPRDAVVREFRKETGLTVKVERARDVWSTVAGNVHTNAVIFEVRITGGLLQPEADGTTEEARWVFPEEARNEPVTSFVAAVLGWTVPESAVMKKERQAPRPTPPSRAKRGRKRRGQRFGAYALTTDDAGRVLLARISGRISGCRVLASARWGCRFR